MNFDLDLMRKRCLASFEDYETEGVLYCSDGGRGNRQFIWDKRDRRVLAVAHLDTVQSMQHFHAVEIDGEPYVINAQLDDRLGAHIILDILPSMGIVCDILLTEGEETGNSTADLFSNNMANYTYDYNWVFSFDRSGVDVVGYDYQCDGWEKLMKDNGFTPGTGSFSDIASLYQLGVWGFNFGTGYYHNHEKISCANLSQVAKMVDLFQAFYWKMMDTPLPYNPLDKPAIKSYGTYHNRYVEDYDWEWKASGSASTSTKSSFESSNGRWVYKDGVWVPKETKREEVEDKDLFIAADIWEILTPEQAEQEEAERAKAEAEGSRPDWECIRCPNCRHLVEADEFFYLYELCLWCFDHLVEDAHAEHPTNAQVTEYIEKNGSFENLDAGETALIKLRPILPPLLTEGDTDA